MMQEFMKLLTKKYEEQGGPKKGPEMEAKSNIAKELGDILGGDLIGKVTVASDSEEGLKKGLEKAEDVIESKMEDESDMEEESEMLAKDMERRESSDSKDKDEKDIRIAELERKIKELETKRA
jgi:hypothetical protein